MNGITRQRCFNHATREAAVRCPGCTRHYCRECVSEHEGRYLCAACVAAEAAAAESAPARRLPLAGILSFAGGFFLLWVVFMAYGRLVFAIPEDYHFFEQRVEGEYVYEGEALAPAPSPWEGP